jgi:adenylylsulfate kinase
MGLPGSGKTTWAAQLKNMMPNHSWLNADIVRTQYNDWDFSHEGRIRQANRMRQLAGSTATIIDMVCPLPEMRNIIDADIIVWMDTIASGRFSDTNNAFVPPEIYNYRITAWNDLTWNRTIQLISS